MPNQENKKMQVTLSNGHKFDYSIAVHVYFNSDTNQYFVESNLHMVEIPKFLNFISSDIGEDEVEDVTNDDEVLDEGAPVQSMQVPKKGQVN